MIKSVIMILSLFFACETFAASIALKVPAMIGGSKGARVAKPGFAANDGAFSAGLTAPVAGKAVTVPAEWRFAANAGAVALSAVRMNPYALVGTAVAAWLLDYGIEYLNGQFVKTPDGSSPFVDGGGWYISGANPSDPSSLYPSSQAAAQAWQDFDLPDSGHTPQLVASNGLFERIYSYINHNGYPSAIPIYQAQGACPVGYNFSYEKKGCISTADKVPVEESDWPQNLPDPVANELIDKGVGLPLDKPIVSPTPIHVPTSDPYYDPVGDRWLRDEAVVTPQPSDPETAVVETDKQEVDPETGEPEKDPETGEDKKPEEEDDFCKKNPDVMACWKEDDDHSQDDLREESIGKSISPVSIGGAGSCPAPKTVSVQGRTVTFTYDPICQVAQGVRPVMIAIAWLIAGYILVGATRE